MIELRCPGCDRTYHFDDDEAGQEMRCACQQTFVVRAANPFAIPRAPRPTPRGSRVKPLMQLLVLCLVVVAFAFGLRNQRTREEKTAAAGPEVAPAPVVYGVATFEDAARAGDTFRVRGEGRLQSTQDLWGGAYVVGLQNPFTFRTAVVCVFRDRPGRLLRTFEHDTSGEVSRYVTIEGRVERLRSGLPHIENAIVMVDCKLIE